MKSLILGIDIGGTNVKFGIVDAKGKILIRSSLPTKSYNRTRNLLLNTIFARIDELLDSQSLCIRDFAGIGIGLPGAVDPEQGKVMYLPNVPGWKNVALSRLFEKKYGVPTFLENDVNMITLGEWKYGAGRGHEELICMTLGTGVGGGLILAGKLYRGKGFVAGEIGHMPLHETGPSCPCGGFACFERYVGNGALLARIAEIYGKSDLIIPDVFKLAKEGDPRALRFWEETATHIGNGLIGVINLLNPQLIIIGGGVSNNHRFLFPTIRKVIKSRAMNVQAKMVKIERAKLGDDAGILGARVLVESEKFLSGF